MNEKEFMYLLAYNGGYEENFPQRIFDKRVGSNSEFQFLFNLDTILISFGRPCSRTLAT